MSNISYRRHRFPPEIIQHAFWLYFRFPLSYRNVEDLLAHCRSNSLRLAFRQRRVDATRQEQRYDFA